MKKVRIAVSLLACSLALLGACTKEAPKAGVPEVVPEPARMRRLLARQYRNSVNDLLGPAARDAAVPPPDVSGRGFESIGAGEIVLGDSAVYQYELSARAIAAAAIATPGVVEGWANCAPSEACLRQLVQDFGRAAWRRPLVAEEVDAYTAIAVAAATEYGSFDRGAEYAFAGMLQSPNFLFIVEAGVPDVTVPGRRTLDGWEMASRLSFFLLDTTPDEDLLVAAETGTLATPEGVRTAAEALLGRAAARIAMQEMYAERYGLRTLSTVLKDDLLYPQFTDTLAAAMRTESLMLLDEIVWERDADYRELFDAPYAWVNAELAQHYGVVGPDAGFAKRQLPEEQRRAGILSQGATMTWLSHPRQTSPTRRGRFVQERLLCNEIPPPPPTVDTALPAPAEGDTMREIMELHQENEQCAGCHALMDPVGFGMESFDAIGGWRAEDGGAPVDDSGEIPGFETFDGVAGLGALLRETPDAHRCFVRNVFRHSVGHVEGFDEEREIDHLARGFEADGFRVKELLLDLVSSQSFRYVGEPLAGAGEPS